MLKLHDYLGKKEELARKPKADNCPGPLPTLEIKLPTRRMSGEHRTQPQCWTLRRPSIQTDGLRDR